MEAPSKQNPSNAPETKWSALNKSAQTIYNSPKEKTKKNKRLVSTKTFSSNHSKTIRLVVDKEVLEILLLLSNNKTLVHENKYIAMQYIYFEY